MSSTGPRRTITVPPQRPNPPPGPGDYAEHRRRARARAPEREEHVPIAGWSPEETSAIESIVEFVLDRRDRGSVVDIQREANREVAAKTSKHRRREIAAWLALVASVLTFAGDRARRWANEIEAEPAVTIPIPVEVTPPPARNRALEREIEEIARVRAELQALAAEERARLEAATAAAKRKGKASR